MHQHKITASIIIPVYNDASSVRKLFDNLSKVDFSEEYEIIFVDNGSTDDTVKEVQRIQDVILLKEHKHLNSPYSARNRGIEKSSGDVIILLDSTCIPVVNWFNSGMDCLKKQEADIIGGDVQFDFEGKMTAGKIYDSLTNIKMKESIVRKGVAKTANLFIRKEVFEKVGLFPEGVRSGADVIWTGKAKQSGCKLQFCPNALVYKKARTFSELIKKQWRVGIHQPMIWKELYGRVSILSSVTKFFKPVLPTNVWKLIRTKGSKEMKPYFFSVWFVAQVIKWISSIANIKGSLKLK